MSLWTNLRNSTEALGSDVSPIDFRGESARKETGGITGFENRVRGKEESAANTVLGRSSSADKRVQAQGISDQIQAYKDQTALTNKEIESTRAQQAVEKRKINEQQIRSLRGNYRPAGGFLNGQGGSSSAGIGNSSGLPSKLGTT